MISQPFHFLQRLKADNDDDLRSVPVIIACISYVGQSICNTVNGSVPEQGIGAQKMGVFSGLCFALSDVNPTICLEHISWQLMHQIAIYLTRCCFTLIFWKLRISRNQGERLQRKRICCQIEALVRILLTNLLNFQNLRSQES